MKKIRRVMEYIRTYLAENKKQLPLLCVAVFLMVLGIVMRSVSDKIIASVLIMGFGLVFLFIWTWFLYRWVNPWWEAPQTTKSRRICTNIARCFLIFFGETIVLLGLAVFFSNCEGDEGWVYCLFCFLWGGLSIWNGWSGGKKTGERDWKATRATRNSVYSETPYSSEYTIPSWSAVSSVSSNTRAPTSVPSPKGIAAWPRPYTDKEMEADARAWLEEQTAAEKAEKAEAALTEELAETVIVVEPAEETEEIALAEQNDEDDMEADARTWLEEQKIAADKLSGILAETAEHTFPVGTEMATQEGQQKLFDYAAAILPTLAACKQAPHPSSVLFTASLQGSQQLLNAVSGVLEDTARRISECDLSRLSVTYWKELSNATLQRAWKSYQFYGEMSVAGEVFHAMTEEIEKALLARPNALQDLCQNSCGTDISESQISDTEAPDGQNVTPAEPHKAEETVQEKKSDIVEAIAATPVDQVWTQYDILYPFSYGWNNMIRSADHIIAAEFTQTDIVTYGFTSMEAIDITDKFVRNGSKCEGIPELEEEASNIAVCGFSRSIQLPVKLIWFNQTRFVRMMVPTKEEAIARRCGETFIRQSFGV